MRRTVLLLATMALTLLVASGVALAVTKIGTDGPDTLRGTNGADNLLGKGGNDVLFALAGDDNLLGGPGKDILFGGSRAEPSGDKNLVGGDGNDPCWVALAPTPWWVGKVTTSCSGRLPGLQTRYRRGRQRRDRRHWPCWQGRGELRRRLRPSARRQGRCGRPRLREGVRRRAQRRCILRVHTGELL